MSKVPGAVNTSVVSLTELDTEKESKLLPPAGKLNT